MKLTKEIKLALNSEVTVKKKVKVDDTNLTDQIKELLEEVNKLKVLKLRLIDKDQSEYNERRDKIREIFDDGDVTVSDISNFHSKLKTVKLIADIGQLANPTSTKLMGNSFIDKMFNLATTILLEELPKEKKVKPAGFLAGLIKSPFVKGLLNSTPVGSIVNGIIGSIKSRAKTVLSEDINLESKLKKFKDLKLETQDAFNLEKVNRFEDSLQNYIKFYDGLRIATQKFETQLELLDLEIISLKDRSSTFYKNFLKGLKITSKNSSLLEKKFPSTAPAEYADLIALLTNKEFLTSFAKYEDYLEMKFRVIKMESDFKNILKEYFTNVKIILKDFANFEKGKTEEKINKLIINLDKKINTIL